MLAVYIYFFKWSIEILNDMFLLHSTALDN